MSKRSRRIANLIAEGRVAWLVPIASLALSIIGIVAIDTAVAGDTGISRSALKQIMFLVAGLVAAVAVAAVHYRAVGQASRFLYLLGLGVLAFLITPGVPASIVRARNGARSWIDLGPIDIQPSELVKIVFVLALAYSLRFTSSHRTLRGLFIPGLITFVPVALITLQPDLGTAALFIPALFAVLIAAGAKLRHMAIIVLAAALAAPASFPILKPHQQARIVGLVKQFQGDTSADQDVNFQARTAQTLIGAGGATGSGADRSRVLLKFNALPEADNDMVFSVVINRWGFFGGIAVMGLYFLWIAAAFITAAATREPLGRLTIVGLSAFVAAQAFINIGMNLGVVPIIGITLPFVSAGGSSMISLWIGVGLIVSIAVRRPISPARHSFEYNE
ncbi:MAG: FtsW/RodA/SpoVE family cell cycle protein [Phycisphaerales bacterium]|nr:FtsW/RodA/SpoVE family cell cycle protein [Phycisphaerales bacterium]